MSEELRALSRPSRPTKLPERGFLECYTPEPFGLVVKEHISTPKPPERLVYAAKVGGDKSVNSKEFADTTVTMEKAASSWIMSEEFFADLVADDEAAFIEKALARHRKEMVATINDYFMSSVRSTADNNITGFADTGTVTESEIRRGFATIASAYHNDVEFLIRQEALFGLNVGTYAGFESERDPQRISMGYKGYYMGAPVRLLGEFTLNRKASVALPYSFFGIPCAYLGNPLLMGEVWISPSTHLMVQRDGPNIANQGLVRVNLWTRYGLYMKDPVYTVAQTGTGAQAYICFRP